MTGEPSTERERSAERRPVLLEEGDVDAAAGVIARAFRDDALTKAIIPETERRLAYAEVIGRRYVREALPYGHAFGVRERGALVGIALWHPPGVEPTSVTALLGMLPSLARMAPTVAGMGPRLAARLLRSPSVPLELGLRRRKAVAEASAGAAWYLAYLATDPAAQGRGVGRALLTAMLDRCDAAGQAAWLETTDPVNPPLYERFGFATVARLDGGALLPGFWVMRREPQDPSTR